eukprot:gene489-917_t
MSDHTDGHNTYCPLHWAAYFDEGELASKIIDNSKEMLDCRTSYGNSSLHVAASQNSMRVLRLLITTNPQNLDVRNVWNETPLHLAVAAGFHEPILALVTAGSSLNATDQWGRIPLMVAREQGQQPIINLLQDLTISEHDMEKVGDGLTPSAEDLTKKATDINQISSLQEHVIKEFLEKLSIIDSFLKSTITIEKGIFNFSHMTSDQDLNITENNFNMEEEKQETLPEQSPNQSTSEKELESYSSLPPLLPCKTQSSRTAISKKIEYPGDHIAIADMLARPEEYDPAGKDMFGWSAIHKFAVWDKVDLLQLLLPVLTYEQLNAQGGAEKFTCLHCSIDAGATRALNYLLQQKDIDTEIIDKYGRTPAMLAKEMVSEHIIELFSSKSSQH